jgi:hypothetical protein
MAVSKRLRFEILRRDNHACRYCGATAPDVKLTVDHVVPEALGGSNEPSNLVTACADCNNGKSSVHPDSVVVEDVQADAIRWANAMSQVAELRNQELEHIREINSWFNAVWCNWTDWRGEAFPAHYGNSIIEFLNAGLVKLEIEEMVSVTMRAKHVRAEDKWKYFCGCCWTRIRDNQKMAAELIAAEEVPPTAAPERSPSDPEIFKNTLAELFGWASKEGNN